MSPIGDALDRIEDSGSSISSDAEVASSDDLASELSKMAENDSDLAKEVEARLRGAKVRFDGTAPMIDAQPDLEPASSTPAPDVPEAGSRRDHGAAAHRTVSRAPIPSLADAARPARQGDRRTARASEPANPARDVKASPAGPVGTGPVRDPAPAPAETAAPASRRRHPYAGKAVRAIPFALIVLFLVLGFDRTVSIISLGIIIGIGALIVTGLVVATSRVGRKTTSMLRDDQAGSGRERRPS